MMHMQHVAGLVMYMPCMYCISIQTLRSVHWNWTNWPTKGKYSHFLCGVFNVSIIVGQHEVRFCPSGPSDVHIHWLINGHSLDTPIMEERHPLGQSKVLVSSWLREGPLIKDARYHCVAEASTGNDMSEVDLHLSIGGIWTWWCMGNCVSV